MKKPTLIAHAFLHAIAGTLYIAAVATFMSRVGQILGPDKPGEILGPVVFLLMFVISAAIMGSIVLLRPIIWYLDGKKKEALGFLLYTVAFLILIALTAVALIAIF
ncbi:MAG: hypothetical protein COU47_03235 [Candidatus Niyogibacteria bacterium CG10_big_fil_rev_8_21_14_0_10_46_36]|uniref:Uncharacterized protein n=1 Tax=Candidatus Niyogibacteria bacterium CG10_big_fil_rev_8_21_14_0_10_46_36 TaxID=1974726 RepID=A0A2H0TCU6_9BACT|nr:MAG: hypothetical protein COU47_03235 [Candidatus Niyogibacteria bacterium CG10_big_fil_rev_8_21_14_0_10_46_36]